MSKRDLAWCLDALIPGVYLWIGDRVWAIGGSEAESSYPFTIKNGIGFAVILPNLEQFATPYELVR